MGKFKNFFVGFALGVGTGILLAPKSGEDTRRELKVKINDLVNYVKDLDKEDVRNLLIKKLTELKVSLEEFDLEESALGAKRKAKEIMKKLDDLKNMAVVKATPYVDNAIEGLRLKTVDVLKITLDKLKAVED